MKHEVQVLNKVLSVCQICSLRNDLQYSEYMTTDCPGHTVFKAQAERVYDGEIDFVDGEWVSTISGQKEK